LALSADGKILASVAAARPSDVVHSAIKLWDATAGKELHSIKIPYKEADFVALTPDGTVAVSGGEQGLVTAWQVATGKQLHSEKLLNSIVSVTISADGMTLMVATESGRVHLWPISAWAGTGE
jgi:WD40 repeat protein